MSGRLEQESKARDFMDEKLKTLPPIFTMFYTWLDTKEKTHTTMKNYINHTVEFMEFFTKGKKDNKFYLKVTEDDIERYMIFIRRKTVDGKEIEVGDDIRAAKWSSLSAFFRFLVQKKHITNNPMQQTERPKVRTSHAVTYLTPEEIASVFDRIKAESREMLKNRDLCVIALGLGTGLRVSAIVNIDVEDIDFKTNSIRVIEKGRKTKIVKFQSNLRSLLLVWMKDRELYFGGEDSGPLFMSTKKQRMSVDSVERMISKYTSHLSKHITPHKLRSSAAMNLYSSGVSLLTIASLLGHESVTTTQRYTRAYDEEKENATSILDNFI